jgi:hypothetical protein
MYFGISFGNIALAKPAELLYYKSIAELIY